MPEHASIAHSTWAERLLDQLEEWLYWSWPRIEGVSDDEYLWEPAQPSWSVRPGPQGGFVLDRGEPPADAPPVTTIAWRLCHIGSGVLANRNAKLFGAPPWDDGGSRYPGTAAEAIAWVRDELERWRTGVRALTDERLLQPVGPGGRSDADRTVAWLVMHIHREVIHHGAEICLLRDLYRTR
jgi:hypothetical protein